MKFCLRMKFGPKIVLGFKIEIRSKRNSIFKIEFKSKMKFEFKMIFFSKNMIKIWRKKKEFGFKMKFVEY